MPSRILGVAAVLVAAVLWGTTGTVQALLPEAREPLVIAALRLLLGAATLILIAAASSGGRRAFSKLPLALIAVAGLAIAAYNVLFFVAVLKTGVGIGTALAIGSAPIWATLYQALFLRRLPDRHQLLGQALSIAGAILLVVSGAAVEASAAGMAMAAVAGVAYATYSLLTSQAGREVPAPTLAASTFAVAALLLAPALWLLPSAWVLAGAAWPKLAFLGIVATGASYVLYTWGLRHVPPVAAVTLALAEPLTAWLLATFVVGEPLTLLKALGALLLLFGLAIVTGAVRPRR